MKKIFKTFLFLLFLQSGILSAQTGKITGKLTSSDKKPIESVLVSLLGANDNVLIKTEISETDGSFSFASLAANDYQIIIENPGYKIYQSQIISIAAEKPEINLPSIVLTVSEINNLDAVTVVKKKPFVERKLDKTVVNVTR